eukprot:gene18077-21601_t
MSELSGGEKKFVFDLEGKDPDFVLWVKKTNKKDVVQDRLFVLSKYRVYSIKRTKLGKKQVQRQGHLYDLVEIKSDDIDRVVLKFTTFTIDITGHTTGIVIPKILINAFHRISYTFSMEASPSLIIIPVERIPPEIDHLEPGFAHGFVEVYKAQCNYYGAAENIDLIQFIEEIVTQGNRVFCLDDFAGIDKNTEHSVNLVPVMAALRHNTFFDTFVCHNKSRKDVVALLADVFHHNQTITSVNLAGIEAEEGWVALGDALRDNTAHQLRYLDVSDNKVGDRGITAIVLAIKALARPFHALSARNVDLQSKAAAVAFRALQANYNASGFIETLDLSHNNIGAMGSDPMQDWLVLMNTANPSPIKPLTHINLAATSIDTSRICNAIRAACLGALSLLDLSNNRLTNEGVHSICTLIAKGEHLETLRLRDTSLLGEHVALILGAATNGSAPIVARTIDLSNNALGKAGALVFAQALRDCTNIDSLKLANCNFRKRGMTSIISALEENRSLKAIDLSNNIKSGSKALAVVDHLARTLQRHVSIERLVLAGKDNRSFFLGRELSPLVKSINEECHLLELDISGNSMGDDLCRELFESIKKNTYLRTLHIDNNSIGLPGFAAMRRCFSTNRTLVEMPVPTRDIARLLSATTKDRKATNDKIGEILNDVATCLSNNKNGVAYTDVPSSTKTTVAISSMTPNYRASTYTNGSSSSISEDSYNTYNQYSRNSTSVNASGTIASPAAPPKLYAPSPIASENANYRVIGNFPILPIKTAHKGPAPKADASQPDVIDEALDLFKANILFRNFEVQGNGDRVLIYLTLYITKCLLKIATLSKQDAEKQLFTMAQEQFSIPGETAFPLGGMITVPASRDGTDGIRQALTQLRLEMGVRLVQRVYSEPSRPNKWWMCFSKRKFLGKAL